MSRIRSKVVDPMAEQRIGRRRSPFRRAVARGAAASLLLLCAACSRDRGVEAPSLFDDAMGGVAYDVELAGAPTDEIAALMEQSLALYRRQERGAPSVALLRRRAESDAPTANKILRSFGYFEATTTAEIRTEPESDRATAALTLKPGPAFSLAAHRFEIVDADAATRSGPLPALDAAALGSPIGATAAAQAILDAETAAVAALQATGRPYARAIGRQATADLDADEIDVVTRIEAGALFAFGEVRFDGLERVDEDYLLTYQPWADGEPYDRAQLTQYQRSLIGTGLFRAGAVRPPETPPEGAAAPVLVSLEEAPRRSVSAGVRYDTDAGPAVRGRLEHRNLFGANEIGSVEAEAGLEEQHLDFGYRKPQFRRPGQTLVAELGARRTDDEAFEEIAGTGSLGVERRLNDVWTASLGGLAEASRLEDADESGVSYLGGAPASLRYDDTDDRLDPSEGFRLRLGATPFIGAFDGEFVNFLSLEAGGSTYYDVFDDRRLILAARSRVASILSDGVDDVPLNRRIYSGGAGSVRGFEERFIGPLDADGDPDGGLSAFEIGGEVRLRVWGDIGVVAFAEGGAVAQNAAPSFEDGFEIGVGGGLRYASPVGPFRLDVGVPLDRRPVDETFQFYLSLGQAF